MTTAALDVNELIREVLSLLRGDLENHRIGADAALPDGLPPVSANAVQLRQVMVNLITNAARYEHGDEPPTPVAAPDASARAGRPPDYGRGHRKRNRSAARRPHLRAVFYDQIPRHGHGAVDLPLHRRKSRRPPFGHAGPDARIDLSGLVADSTAGRGHSGCRYAIERRRRRPVAVAYNDWLRRHPQRALPTFLDAVLCDCARQESPAWPTLSPVEVGCSRLRPL